MISATQDGGQLRRPWALWREFKATLVKFSETLSMKKGVGSSSAVGCLFI